MRVLVLADMDGVAQITDRRECWPACPEYWRTGRGKATADAAAAAAGLLVGGARPRWSSATTTARGGPT